MLARSAALLLLLAGAAHAKEKFNSRVAILQDFPREVGRGNTLVVRGTLKGAYKVPELIVIAPGGKTYKWTVGEVGEHRFRYDVRFEEGVGAYRLELMARKSNAIESGARFTVWHGVPRTPEEKEKPPPTGAPDPYGIHARLIEKRFLAKLNEFRASIGVDPVGWNEKVAERCRQHAGRMAKARRRIHRFGGVGVMQLVQTAREDNLSGPGEGWSRVSDFRPFPPPQPRLPDRKTWNYVVPFVFAEYSLDVLFEKFFVREAAFRLLAADPDCLEVAAGAARAPAVEYEGKTLGNPSAERYWSICFVQVNNKLDIDGQNRAYNRLVKQAGKRDPELLRWVGIWGRDGKPAARLIKGALKDRRPEVVAAAFDALLLLDEARARRELERIDARAAKAWAAARYADFANTWKVLRGVRYDTRVASAAAKALADAEARAREDLARCESMEEPERSSALKQLLRRCRGLEVAAAIGDALSKG